MNHIELPSLPGSAEQKRGVLPTSFVAEEDNRIVAVVNYLVGFISPGANILLEPPLRLIDEIPVLTPAKRNEARRFINLIDALYDNKVGLIASADNEPDMLYRASSGSGSARPDPGCCRPGNCDRCR